MKGAPIQRHVHLGDLVRRVWQSIYAQLKRYMPTQIERMLLLLEVSQALGTTLDLDQLLQMVVDRVMQTIHGATGGVLHLYHADTSELEPVAVAGSKDRAMGRAKLQLGIGISGRAMASGNVVNVPDVLADPSYTPGPTSPRYRSLLVAPLVWRGEPIGTLSIESPKVGAFSPDDARLLGTLAGQAAAAIVNARLYRKQSEMVKSLAEANEALATQYAEVQRLNQQLQAANERLLELDRLKSNLIANVSHEFRAPLASIKAYTELLMLGADEGDTAARRQFLEIVDQSTDRLTSLVTNLLDLSRLEASVPQQRQVIHLADIVKEATAPFNVQARSRDIQIRLDVPLDLEPIAGDKDLLLTLIGNLVSNAVKFSRPGGCVDVMVRDRDDCVELSVADQGIGIPPEALPHIFERFFRVQSTTESGIEGTGLGLAIVKEVTEAHGGTIEVQSTPGVGSCFTIRLPKVISPGIVAPP